jgi:hypothetical protein
MTAFQTANGMGRHADLAEELKNDSRQQTADNEK